MSEQMFYSAMDSTIFDHSKLRGRIVEKYGTLKAFYEKLPYTSEMAFRKVNGKGGLSRQDILDWSNLLDIKVKDIPAYFFVLKVQL